MKKFKNKIEILFYEVIVAFLTFKFWEFILRPNHFGDAVLCSIIVGVFGLITLKAFNDEDIK